MAWATTEDGISFSIGFLRRYHTLQRGNAALNQTCTWRSRGQVFSSISYDLRLDGEEPHIRLYYTHAKTTPVDDTIKMVTTPCHYGGERWWFVCPRTGKRCAVLHNPPRRPSFASRKAFGLKYDSQKEDSLDRATRRFDKLAARYKAKTDIFCGGYFARPKGMHLRTYRRVQAELQGLCRYIDALYFRRFGQML